MQSILSAPQNQPRSLCSQETQTISLGPLAIATCNAMHLLLFKSTMMRSSTLKYSHHETGAFLLTLRPLMMIPLFTATLKHRCASTVTLQYSHPETQVHFFSHSATQVYLLSSLRPLTIISLPIATLKYRCASSVTQQHGCISSHCSVH